MATAIYEFIAFWYLTKKHYKLNENWKFIKKN
jgi:hypothetical protein